MSAAPAPSAFLEAAGLQIADAGPDKVTGWIDLGPQHYTPWGVVHGGVFLTAVESAASINASADVVAIPVQQGAIQQLWEVSITRSDDGKLLAQGRLRLQNVEPRARN